MILDLDIGNTRVKWRLSDAQGNVSVGSHIHDVDQIPFGNPEFSSVERVRVSSVAPADQCNRITDRILASVGVSPEFASTQGEQCGVRNSYADVSRMGVDRWLAMLGAYGQTDTACCVIDAGTAVTLDWIDASGQHLGGYIVPGYATMRRSLLTGTGQVRMVGDSAVEVGLGRSTEAAVSNGALNMLLGFVSRGVEQFPAQSPQFVRKVILTGGDAAMLAEHLAIEFEVNEDLVLDGLALALP